MKITFKYSSGIISGECIIETDKDEPIMMSCEVSNDVTDELFEDLNPEKMNRAMFHVQSMEMEISYPIILSCAESFYGSIAIAEAKLKNYINDIDITTLSDQEKVTL